MPRRHRPALVAAAVVLWTAPLAAQHLRVRAQDEESGQPLGGAIADVLDPQGDVAVQGLLGADGSRLFRVGAAGSYRVRLRRIGYEPFLSAPIAVGAADTVEARFRVAARRVLLTAITVTGNRRCASDARIGGGVAALLEEARKALTAATLARTDTTLVLQRRSFRQVLDARGEDLGIVEVSVPTAVRGERPFAALAARELSDSGYVRMSPSEGTTFYGPDEQVLASEEFLRDHCFEAIAGRDAQAGLLGVRFTPAPRRRTPDIAGTLWVDPATAELRHLDFWYEDARLPRSVRGIERTGGQVVLDRTASGLWYVAAWRLRMPRFAGPWVRSDTRPSEYHEQGGVGSPAGDGAWPPPHLATALGPYVALIRSAQVTGVLFDSLGMRPLAGARIALTSATSGARHTAESDSAGRYTVDSIPAGAYRFAVTHPVLDSLLVPLPRVDVRLRPGMVVAGDFATASRETLARGCARPPQSAGAPGVIVGRVVAAGTSRPVAQASVLAWWTDSAPAAGVGERRPRQATAVTDGEGVYRICGLPRGALAHLYARSREARTGAVEVTGGALAYTRRDLTLGVDDGGWPAPRLGALAGTVRGSDGLPIAGATVALRLETPPGAVPPETAAGPTATSDAEGRFALDSLPTGTQTVVVRREGHAVAVHVVELRAGQAAQVAVVLRAERPAATRPTSP